MVDCLGGVGVKGTAVRDGVGVIAGAVVAVASISTVGVISTLDGDVQPESIKANIRKIGKLVIGLSILFFCIRDSIFFGVLHPLKMFFLAMVHL